jgi:hypothetical protein
MFVFLVLMRCTPRVENSKINSERYIQIVHCFGLNSGQIQLSIMRWISVFNILAILESLNMVLLLFYITLHVMNLLGELDCR